MVEVVADPGWEGGLWALVVLDGERQLLRTDDAGASWVRLEGGPLGAVDISVGPPAPGGRLWATGVDGTWEHTRAAGWTQLSAEPGVVVSGHERPWVTSEEGLWGPEQPVDGFASVADWIPLGDLLYTVMSRRELTESVRASRVVQSLIPDLTLQGAFRPESDLDYDAFTTAGEGARWEAQVVLKWVPAGRSGASDGIEEALDEISLRTGVNASVGADRGVLGAMGGKAGRDASRYRSVLTNDLTALYRQRIEAVAQQAQLRDSTLRERTLIHVHIAQLDARIDALTQGAVSAWNHNLE
jgi:hypothetical protein